MSSEKAVGPRVVIIGSGIGGLSCAIALRQQLHFDNFTIYEQASEIGGTWRDNTYPGCASDTPIHSYTLSTELNPYWSTNYAPQSEIQSYWIHVAEKWDLYSHTIFNSKVIEASWDAEEQRYTIEVEDVKTGEKTVTYAQIVISAIGILREPLVPTNIKGISSFKGEIFHSGQWQDSVDLRNKRVGVVGNGSSAIQFVPRLVAEPSTHVVNFCRSPVWFVSRDLFEYSATDKWIFANVPFAMRLYRLWILLAQDKVAWSFRGKDTNATRDKITQASTDLIKRKTPSKYHDKLIPNYPPGCKRIVVDRGYLDCLRSPNIDLNWDGIEEIVEDGIITRTGEKVPLDVIIFATGFVSDSFPVKIKGDKGQWLADYFAEKNGPTAYLGVTVPGFPNFYLIGGPNTTTSSGPVVLLEEIQINHILQLAAPVLKGLAKSFTVLDRACDAYNAVIQRKIADSVFVYCRTWYQTSASGKNFVIFPGPLSLFWWKLRSPVWDDYVAVGADKWRRQLRVLRALKWIGLSVFGLGLFSLWKWPTLLNHLKYTGITLHRASQPWLK